MNELDAFQRAADADLAALLHEELARRRRRLRGAEAARRRARFRRSAAARARPAGRATRASAARSSRASRTSSSTSSRTPIRCRPRSCCCSRPTIRRSATGAAITPVPGKLFIVGDPKQAIYRFRRADVETYREVCELLESRGAQAGVPAHQLPRDAGDPARRERGVRAADDRRSRRRCRREYVALVAAPSEDRPAQPAVVALPVPEPYGTAARRRLRDREVAARRRRRVRALAARRERLDGHRADDARRAADGGADPAAARLHPVPPLPALRRGRHAAVRRRARGARRAAPARRRQVVPRPRGGRDDARRAGGDRVARRRAVGVRDAARRALRDRRRDAARVSPSSQGVPSVPRAATSCRRSCGRSADALRLLRAAARRPQLPPGRRHDHASCSTRRARTSASCCGRPASRRSPTCCTSPSSRASTRSTAACRSAASSRSCASRPTAGRRPKRRFSRRAATACG